MCAQLPAVHSPRLPVMGTLSFYFEGQGMGSIMISLLPLLSGGTVPLAHLGKGKGVSELCRRHPAPPGHPPLALSSGHVFIMYTCLRYQLLW